MHWESLRNGLTNIKLTFLPKNTTFDYNHLMQVSIEILSLSKKSYSFVLLLVALTIAKPHLR